MNADALLSLMKHRRSVRSFSPRPVERGVLERLIEAATAAPSASNRQPWRFHVVTAPGRRRAIAEAVRARVAEMEAIIAQGHHRDDYGRYGDFFHEPLQAATVLIVPACRSFPDLIAQLLQSGGGDPSRYLTAAAMQPELCSTAAACMSILLQAEAEGLGACWMAGPTVARPEIQRIAGILPPFQMLGVISLGWPDEQPPPRERRPIDTVVRWLDTDEG